MIDDSLIVYKCLKCNLIFRRNQEQNTTKIFCPVCGPKKFENGDSIVCVGPDLIRKLRD